jgi:lipid II:glycine glycyltransferase (peptidoglycan interpeptide bridge formation enzyme)
VNGTLKLVIIKNGNTIVASGFFMKSGSCLHYIMGSSNKEIKKLNGGYLIHWIGIQISIELKFKAYNISIGGPANIENIKDDFGRSKIQLKTTYIWKT